MDDISHIFSSHINAGTMACSSSGGGGDGNDSGCRERIFRHRRRHIRISCRNSFPFPPPTKKLISGENQRPSKSGRGQKTIPRGQKKFRLLLCAINSPLLYYYFSFQCSYILYIKQELRLRLSVCPSICPSVCLSARLSHRMHTYPMCSVVHNAGMQCIHTSNV